MSTSDHPPDSERSRTRNRQLEEIFEAALDVVPEERAVFLDRVCAGDDELRWEVESLLELERAQTLGPLPPGELAAALGVADLHPSLKGLALAPGMQMGRYKLLRPLGQGGMGTVFLARDTRLYRRVAIKFLHAATSEMTARFLAEARATARCKHENIVVIHDVDELDGRPYMVLEHLEGESLRQRLAGLTGGSDTASATPAARRREAPATAPAMPLASVLELIIPVVRALVCAHEHGIVHRDLKPENVFLCNNGTVKVLDFGIAKVLTDAHGLGFTTTNPAAFASTMGPQERVVTEHGALLGTLPYMSPEQWGADEIDERTDVWAVGIMLYEMVAGRHPLAPLSYNKLQQQIPNLDLSMPSVELAIPGLGVLAEVIDGCLLKRKAERLRSADALLRALEEVHRGQLDLPGVSVGDATARRASAADAARGQIIANEQTKEAALSRLLTEIFDSDGAGLLRWVRLHLGKAIHDELPAGIPLSQLAFDATLAIQRHGLAEQAFSSLFNERPGQAGHIQQVAMLWDVKVDSGGEREPAIPASTTAMARLWRVPDLPPHYLTRQGTINAVVRALLSSDGGKIGISAMSPGSGITKTDKHGLHGMGGIGKSVLAVAVARQPDIAERFTDGIFWLSVGQDPKLESLQAQFCQALGHTADFDHAADGKQRLRDILAEKAVLLVLDDVWTAKHAGMLDVVGPRGSLLVTTRDSEVLTWLDARDYPLDIMQPEESLALLADWTQLPVTALPAEAARVADACGHLPVALAMIGALVRRRQNWNDMLRLLDYARLTKLKGDIPGYDYDNVFQVIDVSVAALAAESDGARARRCYVDLAVFPEDTPIPRAALRIAWARHGLDHYDADELASTFADRALARLDQAGRLTLHDLQRLYALSQVGDLAALHGAFADAYLARRGHAIANRPDGPYAGLDDGYFFQHLPWHLTQAGRHDALAALLFDFDWLEAKLDATSVTDLLADFALLPTLHAASREARLVHDALRLSSHALAHNSRQLPSQLIGRLDGLGQGNAHITVLLVQTRSMTRYRWLRPVTPSLTPPGGPLVRTLDGHAALVNDVAVTADCRYAVSASSDHTLKLWDLEQGTELRTLLGHTGPVNAVVVTADGRRAVSASSDGSLKLWDLAQGTELSTLAGHTSSVRAVAVTSDSRCVISASDDGTLKLWDLNQGTELRSLAGREGSVGPLAVTPDGRHAVVASKHCLLTVWDLERGTKLRSFTGPDYVTTVTVTPDGRRAVFASKEWDNSVLTLYDVEQGTELHTLGEDWLAINAVAMTPDSRRAVSISQNGNLKLWDLEQGTELRSWAGHAGWFHAVAMAPDGRRAISVTNHGTLMLWDLEQGNKLPSLARHWMHSVTLTPDGRRAVSFSSNGILKLWNLEDGTELRTMAGPAHWLSGVVVTPDGRHAISAWSDGFLRLLDLEQGTELHSLAVDDFDIHFAARTPDGRRAIVGSLGCLKLWDYKHGTELRSLTDGSSRDNQKDVAMTPDGRLAVSTSLDDTLRLWDLDQGTELRTLGHAGKVTCVAVTPNGRRAVSASHDGTLKLWDLDRGTELKTLVGHEDFVRAVAVTPDGRRAVSASHDDTLKLWDLDQGTELKTLDRSGAVAGVTPDGRRALARHGDTLKLWDLEEGTELQTLGHEGWIWSVALTPDGQQLAVLKSDDTLTLWNLDTYQVLATFTTDSEISDIACSSTLPVYVAVDKLGRIYILELVEPNSGSHAAD